ncbi:hypothetical protein RvY_12585 [Ramazzottius varieornatus]|uniref:RRM domain-containing protein n=1 Tax=Ramazzottius varieornatus TaxID=947166 RepID=A0A1D1VK24_RAMVA|nr:hypothetical protein RvY_12585 [Ramazzottius varieornatus]
MASRKIPRLFVGNVAWTVSKKELRDYFSQYGQVSMANVFFDRNTGLSRNFGFVQFASREGYLNSSKQADHFLEGNRMIVADVNSTHEDSTERRPQQKYQQPQQN